MEKLVSSGLGGKGVLMILLKRTLSVLREVLLTFYDRTLSYKVTRTFEMNISLSEY